MRTFESRGVLYHLMGIGGIGMSALAHLLLQRGETVSGSDLCASSITDDLIVKGAQIHFSHDAKNVEAPSIVVYSTDIRDDNPEFLHAKKSGCQVMHRSTLLFDVMHGYRPLLVAGTHGKTTTSSLLAHLLIEADLAPSFAVGGVIKNLNANGGYGLGEYFVAEADESDGSLLPLNPYGMILTNLGKDHLDYWHTFSHLKAAFSAFAEKNHSSEHLFWCAENEPLVSLRLKGYSYGFHPSHSLWIKRFVQEGWNNRFDFTFRGVHYNQVDLPLIGVHNVLNAAAVFGIGLQLHIPEETIRKAFTTFQGICRRLEFKGEKNQIRCFDDYGHHPTEIMTTLQGLKQAIGGQRLVVAFQPHRYTRTKECFSLFGPALIEADLLIITDIYAAREQPIEGIDAPALFRKIQRQIPNESHYIPQEQLSSFLAKTLRPRDVLLTLGAGDITYIGAETLKCL